MYRAHLTMLRLFITVSVLTTATAFGSKKVTTPQTALTKKIETKKTTACPSPIKKDTPKSQTPPSIVINKEIEQKATPTAPNAKQKATTTAVTKVEKKKKNVRMSEMTYAELKEEKSKLIAKGNTEIAIKYIEKMVPLCSDLDELSDLMLEFADLLFDAGNLAKAERLYSEFSSMYPGHKKAEYASYKAIICSYWATLDHQRDQSKTKETIERAEAFLKHSSSFVTYGDQVDEILYACREKLLESEMAIFHYYLEREDYLAAQTRLENIEKEILPTLPAKEPVIISLACELATKQNNMTILEEKKTILAQRFPDFTTEKPLAVASASTTKQAVDRF